MVDSGVALNVCPPSWESGPFRRPAAKRFRLTASRTSNSFVGKKGFAPATFLVSQVQSQGLETVFKPTAAFVKFPRNIKAMDL
eukprot:8586362-Alexandrium_andersonii.AAC.1